MNKLEWDSEFWDIDIYDLNISESSKCEVPFIQNRKLRVMQSLVESDDIDSIRILENKKFLFIQNKITFTKKTNLLSNVNLEKFRKVTLDEINENRDLLNEMFLENSRFNLFDKSKIGEFYFLWITKSILGNFDDECTGYYVDNILAGFITYRFKNEEICIGLIGVFPRYARMGIGQQLLNYLNDVAIGLRCSKIIVSTQGTNYRAINAYIRNGYFINNISSWYYLID